MYRPRQITITAKYFTQHNYLIGILLMVLRFNC